MNWPDSCIKAPQFVKPEPQGTEDQPEVSALVIGVRETLTPQQEQWRICQMKFARASGILLHPTSLPGSYGMGELGPAAYSSVDFLQASGRPKAVPAASPQSDRWGSCIPIIVISTLSPLGG